MKDKSEIFLDCFQIEQRVVISEMQSRIEFLEVQVKCLVEYIQEKENQDIVDWMSRQ